MRNTSLPRPMAFTIELHDLSTVTGGAGSEVEYTPTSVEEYKTDDAGNTQHSKAEAGTQTVDEKGNVTITGPTHSTGDNTPIPNGTFGPG
jgi:hypothetical protein